jgi:MFS transporter, OFA family, oxalate/formate antiporter
MSAEVSKNKGWFVTFSGTGINLALGMLYSWSVINAYISAPAVDAKTGLANLTTWGYSAAQGALPYSVALGVFAIVMVFAGRAQDKFGPRLVATIGGAMMGLGLMVASLASKTMSPDQSIWLLVLGFGVLGGAGIGLGYASATPAAVKWFPPSKKGLITGIVVAGFGLASVYVSPMTTWLLSKKVSFYFFEINGLGLGVAKTFLIEGIFFFVVTVILAQFLKNPPKDYVAAVVAPKADAPEARKAAPKTAHRDYTWQEMIKTPQFYILWTMYAFVSFAGLMIIGHMAKIYKVQMPADAVVLGFLLVAILAIGNASGRIVAGIVSDKIGRPMTMMIFFVSQAVFMGILYLSGAPIVLAIGAFGVGFNYGANLTLFPANTMDFFGVKNMGVNYGLVFTAWGFGGVLGSMAAGWIVDATAIKDAAGVVTTPGNYTIAYAIAAGLCLLAAVMTLILKPPKRGEMPTLEEAETSPEG